MYDNNMYPIRIQILADIANSYFRQCHSICSLQFANNITSDVYFIVAHAHAHVIIYI